MRPVAGGVRIDFRVTFACRVWWVIGGGIYTQNHPPNISAGQTTIGTYKENGSAADSFFDSFFCFLFTTWDDVSRGFWVPAPAAEFLPPLWLSNQRPGARPVPCRF